METSPCTWSSWLYASRGTQNGMHYLLWVQASTEQNCGFFGTDATLLMHSWFLPLTHIPYALVTQHRHLPPPTHHITLSSLHLTFLPVFLVLGLMASYPLQNQEWPPTIFIGSLGIFNLEMCGEHHYQVRALLKESPENLCLRLQPPASTSWLLKICFENQLFNHWPQSPKFFIHW